MTNQWHKCFVKAFESDVNKVVDHELTLINQHYPNANVSVTYIPLSVEPLHDSNGKQTDCLYSGDVTIVYDIGNPYLDKVPGSSSIGHSWHEPKNAFVKSDAEQNKLYQQIFDDANDNKANKEELPSSSGPLERNDIILEFELANAPFMPFIGKIKVKYYKEFTVIQFINWIRMYFSDRVLYVNVRDKEKESENIFGTYTWEDSKLQAINMNTTHGAYEFDELFNRTIVRMSAEIPNLAPGVDIDTVRIKFDVYIFK